VSLPAQAGIQACSRASGIPGNMDFSYFLDSRLRGNDTLSGNRILSGHYNFGFPLVRERHPSASFALLSAVLCRGGRGELLTEKTKGGTATDAVPPWVLELRGTPRRSAP